MGELSNIIVLPLTSIVHFHCDRFSTHREKVQHIFIFPLIQKRVPRKANGDNLILSANTGEVPLNYVILAKPKDFTAVRHVAIYC